MKKFGLITLFLLLITSTICPAFAKEPKNILMVLWRDLAVQETLFKQHLKDMGVNATYTRIDAKQDLNRLMSELRSVQADILLGRYDVIYSYGTTVTSMLKHINTNQTPVVFTVVFDPIGAGIVDSFSNPGGHVTGVSNGVPAAAQLETFRRLIHFKNMALIFTAREKNAHITAKDVQQWASEKGVHLSTFRVAPGSLALDNALEEIASAKVPYDIVYAGPDSYMITQAEKVRERLGNQIPLFGGTATFINKGWLGAYAPRLNDLSLNTALTVKRVLDGESPQHIPVTTTQPILILSQKALDNFGIIPPKHAIIRP